MFGGHFYHERIRKAVAMFGALFNNIIVVRKDASGKTLNQQRVPLSYSPADKYIQRIKEQASLDNDMKVAIKLPRMSFEMNNLAYDPTRMLPKTGNITVAGSDNTKRKKVYNTVPYNISFQLNIYARAQDDCLQIVEQILPYFSPQYTVTIKPIEELPALTEDVPVVLTGVTFSDDYEGNLEDRRIIIYSLDFEMKCNFHSDITESSIIRKATNRLYQLGAGLNGADLAASKVTLFPDPVSASKDSDYGFTQVIERYEELFAQTYQLTLAAQPAIAVGIVNSSRGIGSIELRDSGLGFTAIPQITIDPPPDPILATAVAVLDSAARSISNVVLVDSGTNYLTVPVVAFSAPDIPTRATCTAVLDSATNRILRIDLTDNGTNYDNLDSAYATVTIGGPDSGDSGAYAYAVISGQSVASIVITDSGRGYTTVPYVSIEASPLGVRAQGRAYVQDQRLILVEIVDSGTNYNSIPTVSIAAPPGATQATATAVLNINKEISSITITDPGSNYRTTPLVLISNPIATQNVQYQDSEEVTLTLDNDVIVYAKVRHWNDSDNILTIDTLTSSDNASHELPIGTAVTGMTSNAKLQIATVVVGDKGF